LTPLRHFRRFSPGRESGGYYSMAWWDFVFGPLTGLSLPTALPLAASVYIGISFIL
jgi:hypothetical protein